MGSGDPSLLAAAREFADEVADLLHQTVVEDPPIRAEVAGGRVVVAAFDDDDNVVGMPLVIAGEERLALRTSLRCTFDFTGAFLAVEQSEFALLLPSVRQPVVRFDYVRDRGWSAAHVQLHAESSAVGYLRALAGKQPETWRLHLPVGGRRFRPSLEDVIEFAVHEFGVEAKHGWLDRIEEGRRSWRMTQVKAAIRDAIKDDLDSAPRELRQTIDDAVSAVSVQASDQ